MIGNLPLFTVLMIWLLQRMRAPRITLFNYGKWMGFIQDMRMTLPVPRGGLERQLMVEILISLDVELERIETLRDLGALGCGLLSRE